MKANYYITTIKTKLAASTIVATVEIVTERIAENRGYFRAHMNLINGDFLEVSEYFAIQAGQSSTIEYRYQWMDGGKTKLIKRWDNAEHHPNLANFPHHIHIGDKKQVVPGRSLSIIDLLNIIEQSIEK
ncbi:MAG: hypothetical protein B6I38_05030 [Anaerolineaceae bacterium 4572_5.1]|nr:MAG: hypothetical protein B6I38_05030 [Anaerolineaceae bacterium 4572_5.1]RLD03311.1 MAG: hypothetical protein DRI56_12710 [Chloroflexota bacterium]